jgi:hypothetical protein
MRAEILDASGSVINTVLADPAFLDAAFPDRWREVPEPPPEPIMTPRMTHFGFLSRFTPTERTAVRAQRASDPILDDAMFLFEQARDIDVTLDTTQQLVGYLAQQGLIEAARVPDLLAPIPADSPHAVTS